MAIIRTELEAMDRYDGTIAELIAAGHMREDQLPPMGRSGISYYNGVAIRGRCRRDLNYLRIEVWGETASVYYGLSEEVSAERKKVAAAQWAAKWAAREQEERAEKKERRLKEIDSARESLSSMPKSAQEYRRELARQLRSGVFFVVSLQEDLAKRHGYFLPEESQQAIKFAADALVEAAMAAEVVFDEKIHAAAVAEHQATIRAADPVFYAQLDRLTMANPSILEGEQA
jgi:hypothetical protein